MGKSSLCKPFAAILIAVWTAALPAALEDAALGLESRAMADRAAGLLSVACVNVNPSIGALLTTRQVGVRYMFDSGYGDEGTGNGMTFYANYLTANRFGIHAGVNYFGFGGVEYPGVQGDPVYSELYISGGASYLLRPDLSVGLGLKVQEWRLNADKTGRFGAMNVNVTLGAYWKKPWKNMSFGLYLDNLFKGDLTSGTGFGNEHLPVNIGAGISTGSDRYGYEAGIDLTSRLDSLRSDLAVSLGCKYRVYKNILTIMHGVRMNDMFRNFTLTSGLRIAYSRFLLEYAVRLPLNLGGNLLEHSFGVVTSY